MTEDTVPISITIRVYERELKIEKKAELSQLEEAIHGIVNETGRQILELGIKAIDDRIAEAVPEGWKNAGTEERWIVTSVGELRYKRRIYKDEEQNRRKPIDELMGIERYSRMSKRVQEMGASLASTGTYRLSASQLSWLIKTPISHSSLQRMAWHIGNQIADGEEEERRRVFDEGGSLQGGTVSAPVLYGESDGLWVHLQREKSKSTEIRTGIMSTGKTPIGKDRYRLENKIFFTGIGMNAEMWQEQILREAHLNYDLSKTQLIITGGDGNQWVRHSFDRLQIKQEFVLDRFHLHRAARRAIGNREEAKQIVSQLEKEGFDLTRKAIIQQIDQAEGSKREKLIQFYKYVYNNQDGLLDLDKRGYNCPFCLGAIEGNLDKLVVSRVKGRGRSWRRRGLRAILALCRFREELKLHAYDYLPIHRPEKHNRCMQNLKVDYSETIQKPMPIFQGPDQDKPWVRSLFRFVHGRNALSS
jgi:hypothetical protein